MNKRKERTTDTPLYMNAESLAAALDCGRLTADKIGKAAGAKVKIGGCARYNVETVKKYLHHMEMEQLLKGNK